MRFNEILFQAAVNIKTKKLCFLAQFSGKVLLLLIFSPHSCRYTLCRFTYLVWVQALVWIKLVLNHIQNLVRCISMTTLLTHTVAHSTKSSFMPKTNNQLPKKFLSLAPSCAKVVKNGKILTFKVNFLCQKISESL